CRRTSRHSAWTGRGVVHPFSEKIRQLGAPLARRGGDTLQVNLGRYCNLACIHCHVESGPTRTEMMSRETVDAVLAFLARSSILALDLTGGVPRPPHPHAELLGIAGAY